MPITHTNAKGQIFSLYQGTTKTGKAKYYFTMQGEGTLAQAIPAGYEILAAALSLGAVPAAGGAVRQTGD